MPWLAPVTTMSRSSRLNEASGSSPVADISRKLLRRLEQNFTQPLRRVDHHVVAARHLVGAPGRIGLDGGERAVEARVGVARGAHIGPARDAVDRAGEPDP